MVVVIRNVLGISCTVELLKSNGYVVVRTYVREYNNSRVLCNFVGCAFLNYVFCVVALGLACCYGLGS